MRDFKDLKIAVAGTGYVAFYCYVAVSASQGDGSRYHS